MIGDGKMDVQLDVSKASRVSRLEVIEGPTGRRNRSAAEKAKIAAESLVPGAEVATVARQHGVTRWQVYDWRRRLQQGRLSLPDSLAATFAPLMLDELPKTLASAVPGKRLADPLVLSMTEACKAGLGSTGWRYDCRRQNGRPIGRLEGEPRQPARGD